MAPIATEIQRLREEIEAHNYAYYVLSAPTISDYDFDQLLKQLERLEAEHPELITPDSPTQRVGRDRTEGFTQVAHRYPMLSLGNTYSYDDVREFYERVSKDLGGKPFTIIAELKYDGLSISLTYEKGLLTRAVTRGDGQMGDDVTANVRTIRSIPLRLRGTGYPESLEVRGEILLPFVEFDRLNAERHRADLPLFANPRNAASGTLKQLDPAIVAERRLDAYLYYVPGQPSLPDSHYERLQLCKSWGLKISEATRRCHSLEEVLSFLDYWEQARAEAPVATDGVVLKVDSITEQEELGYTAKTPRWAIAYKYQAEQAKTRLISVDFQVGRTGAVTPVANLDAVTLSGTTVRRASLHNADFIEAFDLHIDDQVLVEKGGEIIPKIVGVVTEERPSDAQPVIFPSHCPACGSPLERNEGEAAYYCTNQATCPPQQTARIEHFSGRKAADIRLGAETIDLLFTHGLVHSIADLYRLKLEDLLQLPGFKERSATRLLESIEASKERPFRALLFGLGIRFVGETVAKTLVQRYADIDALGTATFEELTAIPDIGAVIAESLVHYFASPENREFIAELQRLGLPLSRRPEEEPLPTTDHAAISGKAFVISGVFTHHSREEYKALIESLGGKIASSISSKTSYILAGANMGPAKLAKATDLGITILSEDEFLALIEPHEGEQPAASTDEADTADLPLFSNPS
ncbi:NAD-dependent DNA ligase LigA [Porphyromonas sp.]|uniref:NAD-dependent DNA ligase LigA n=1 Tax=Porphyromonas sp. TaxID=1924944 RepID=UPI001CAEB515|nr:NAD-dependent DNA ligase LigA [Porphyromonas sp.]MBF1382504.1 NAD-dependent DNA ligase LigA [Porphyromonas sp.]